MKDFTYIIRNIPFHTTEAEVRSALKVPIQEFDFIEDDDYGRQAVIVSPKHPTKTTLKHLNQSRINNVYLKAIWQQNDLRALLISQQRTGSRSPVFQHRTGSRSPIFQHRTGSRSPMFQHRTCSRSRMFQHRTGRRSPMFRHRTRSRSPMFQHRTGSRSPMFQHRTRRRSPMVQHRTCSRSPMFQHRTRSRSPMFQHRTRSRSPTFQHRTEKLFSRDHYTSDDYNDRPLPHLSHSHQSPERGFINDKIVPPNNSDGGQMKRETYGLRPWFLQILGITTELTNFVMMKPGVNMDALSVARMFSLAGNVVGVKLVITRKKQYSGFGLIEMGNCLEAVQAISMLHGQTYFGTKLKLKIYINPRPQNDYAVTNIPMYTMKSPNDLPVGLLQVGPGLSPNGSPKHGLHEQMQKHLVNEGQNAENVDINRKTLETTTRQYPEPVNQQNLPNDQYPEPTNQKNLSNYQYPDSMNPQFQQNNQHYQANQYPEPVAQRRKTRFDDVNHSQTPSRQYINNPNISEKHKTNGPNAGKRVDSSEPYNPEDTFREMPPNSNQLPEQDTSDWYSLHKSKSTDVDFDPEHNDLLVGYIQERNKDKHFSQEGIIDRQFSPQRNMERNFSPGRRNTNRSFNREFNNFEKHSPEKRNKNSYPYISTENVDKSRNVSAHKNLQGLKNRHTSPKPNISDKFSFLQQNNDNSNMTGKMLRRINPFKESQGQEDPTLRNNDGFEHVKERSFNSGFTVAGGNVSSSHNIPQNSQAREPFPNIAAEKVNIDYQKTQYPDAHGSSFKQTLTEAEQLYQKQLSNLQHQQQLLIQQQQEIEHKLQEATAMSQQGLQTPGNQSTGPFSNSKGIDAGPRELSTWPTVNEARNAADYIVEINGLSMNTLVEHVRRLCETYCQVQQIYMVEPGMARVHVNSKREALTLFERLDNFHQGNASLRIKIL